MLLFDHPIWKYIVPYAALDEGRMNVDFLQLPDDLRELALKVEVNCCACGRPIYPLRARAKSERSRVGHSITERRLFYAPTCPTDIDSGCSRTHEAKQHKIASVARLLAQGVKLSG